MSDGFISPTRLVVPNPMVGRSNALPGGSLGPNTQQPGIHRVVAYEVGAFHARFPVSVSLENAARVFDLRPKTCRPVVDEAPRRKQKKTLWFPG